MARQTEETRDPTGIRNVDPEEKSQFAATKRRAEKKKVEPGVDPATGERAAISFRELYNKFEGDETKARDVWNRLKQAGGFGVDIEDHQYIDIRSLGRAVEENKVTADQAEDLYARRQAEQRAQHQDNLHNDVRDLLEEHGLNS